jgi:hypothetical protein
MDHSASISKLGDSSATVASERGVRVAKHRRSTEAAMAVCRVSALGPIVG